MEHFAEYTETVGACQDCGNSPTNHFLKKITSDADVRSAVLLRRLESHPRFRAWRYSLLRMGDALSERMFEAIRLLGLAKYSTDIEKARTYRSRVIWQEALRRGYKVEQALIFGQTTELYRVMRTDRWEYYMSVPIPLTKDQTSYSWIDDKFLLKEALAKQGIAVPKSVSAVSLSDAQKAFAEIGGTVIVKPRVGTRGRHTTTNIRSAEALEAAFRSAKKLCSYVSIEENLVGSVCRGTVVDGVLVGFFQADPPILVGDGVSTISQLIEQTNAAKEERVGAIEMTYEMESFLRRSGLGLDSVPSIGEKIALTHRTGRLFGGKTRELLKTVHPILRAHIEKAARVLDIAVVGFDLIIEDPEADPDSQKWGIIEANTLPFIDLHYLPLYGEPSNPAAAVWDLWEKSIDSGKASGSAA